MDYDLRTAVCGCGRYRRWVRDDESCEVCRAERNPVAGRVLQISQRDKPGPYPEVFPPDARWADPTTAAFNLLRWEIGYGGRVADVSEQDGTVSITTKTRVMAALDTVTIRGDAAAMAPVVFAVKTFLEVRGQAEDRLIDEVFDKLATTDRNGRAGTSPFVVKHFAPLVMGRSLLHYTIAVMAGASYEDVVAIRTDDILPVLQLSLETGLPFREVAAELGAAVPAAA